MSWYFVVNEGSAWFRFMMYRKSKTSLLEWQTNRMTNNESDKYQMKKKQTKRNVLNLVKDTRHRTTYNINSWSDWITYNTTAATYKIWWSTWVASVKNFVSTHFSKYFILTSFSSTIHVYVKLFVKQQRISASFFHTINAYKCSSSISFPQLKQDGGIV